MPGLPVREQGDDGRSPFPMLAAPLADGLQPAAITDVRADSTSSHDPLAPPAAFGCLGCGGLRQAPCSCGALSTRRLPALPGGSAVTKWTRFVLAHFAQLCYVCQDLTPLLCFSSLLATSRHRSKVRAGQHLSIPLRLAGTTWCLWSKGTSGRLGLASRLSLLPLDHAYIPIEALGQSWVVLGRRAARGQQRGTYG